jgi:hypothetical protein
VSASGFAAATKRPSGAILTRAIVAVPICVVNARP